MQRAAGQGELFMEPVWLAVLESALDSIIVMDAKGDVREFNPAAQAMFGYAREETLGKPLADLIIPEEYKARHWAGLRRYIATGEGPVLRRRVELEGQRKDGSRIPVELAIVPFKVGDEPLFAGYLRDLSERERAKQQIKRKNDLAVFLREVPLAAARATTLDDAVRASLEAVCRFTGWPLGHSYFLDPERRTMRSRGIWNGPDDGQFSSVRQKSEDFEFQPGGGFPGRVWSLRKPLWVRDVTEEGNFPRKEWARDERIRAAFGFPVIADGEVQVILEFFTARASEEDTDLIAALDAVGRELGYVIERVASRQRLAEANEHLRHLSESRQHFLSQAAHELNNPLTTILLQVEMLSTVDPVTPAQRRYLDLLRGAAERIQLLGRDLLDAARVEGGKLRLEKSDIDLADIVRDAVANLQPLAQRQRITLSAQAEPCVVHGDRLRLGQVVDNLLANALRFTPKGGHVQATARCEGPNAVLEVTDNGAGIEAQDLGRLFRPFEQLHRASHKKGTGLGLFISQGIVQAHGGLIRASSPGPGQGTTFSVCLPLVASDRRARPRPRPDEARRSEGASDAPMAGQADA